MKRRSNTELAAIVWGQLTRAGDYSTQSLQEVRRKAWNYYLNRPRGDEIEGRSQVQDTTVRDMHHALLSTIMPSYATDHVVSFEPVGQGDEDQAEAESAAVNNIFTEDNRGYNELESAVSDALLFRNGVIKVWVDETEERQTALFELDASEGAIRAYYKGEGAEVESITADDEAQTVTVVYQQQKLMCQSIEPSYFFVDPNLQSKNLQDAAFVAERVIMTRDELRQEGISKAKINELPELSDKGVVSAPGVSATDVQAKFQDGQPTYSKAETWSEERVECYWVYMKVDGERWRFLASHEQVLLKDPVNFWPYASGVAWPVPHRWSGLGLYDLLHQTQDAKTSILRQYIDNLNVASNARPVFDPATTNKDDIANGAPGRGIRSTDPTSLGWMPTVDVTTQALAGLTHFDDVSARQAGAALEMATSEATTMKDISGVSAEMQTGPAEQLASQIGRNIAETLVRELFLLIHRTLREEWRGTIMFRKTDQWQEVAPSEWRPRNRINVSVGLSPGDRRRHRAALEFVLAQQTQLIAGGAANIAVTYKGYYNALSDWMKAAELDGAEGYFLDPDGQQSQQGQQAAAQQAQQPDPLIQIQVALEQAQQQLDKYKHDSQLKFDYDELAQKAEIEEAKLVADGINAQISSQGQAGGAGGADQGNGADRGSQG